MSSIPSRFSPTETLLAAWIAGLSGTIAAGWILSSANALRLDWAAALVIWLTVIILTLRYLVSQYLSVSASQSFSFSLSQRFSFQVSRFKFHISAFRFPCRVSSAQTDPLWQEADELISIFVTMSKRTKEKRSR